MNFYTEPESTVTLQRTYPFNYLTTNGLTFPSTFTNLCINTNDSCPNSIPLPRYNQDYTILQKNMLAIGKDRLIKYNQLERSPYIGLYDSNMFVWPPGSRGNLMEYGSC